MRIRAALAAVAIALAVPATGAGGEGDEEENESVTRVSCLGGIAELRLETDDDDDDGAAGDSDSEIAVALRVNARRPVAVWRLVLLHERRIVYRGTRRSTGSSYRLRYTRRLPDWLGRQTVAARIAADIGRTCRLEATI
jgi:hypothetical protein